jgi:hypothetical protein
MSYMLRPEDEEHAEAHHHVALLTREPISLKRIGIAVSLGSVIIIALAGVPSFPRHHHRLPVSDGLSHDALPFDTRAGVKLFPELESPVDPVTCQRPAYPTILDMDARLQAEPGWHDAVLLPLDATVADLHAAGITDPALCDTLLKERHDAIGTIDIRWRLLLLDDRQRIIGREDLFIAAPGFEQMVVGDADITKAPCLDARMPDWPRVAVFTHDLPEVPSDG